MSDVLYNLCYGMKTINITQPPGGSFSHKNLACDLSGEDSGRDVWRAVGFWKCTAGAWGNHTYFFTSCNAEGRFRQVRCADGRNRVITLALTHSDFIYHKPVVGRIYKDNEVMYEEGSYGEGVTGNHIHAEIAQGVQTEKHYDEKLGVWRMNNELDICKLMFVCVPRSVIKNSHGLTLPLCYSAEYQEGTSVPEGSDFMKLYLHAKNCSFNIRRGLTFSGGKNTTDVLYTVKKGGKAAVLDFTERLEEDGYEWVHVQIDVDRKPVKGYAQMDMKNYILKTR